MNSRLRPLLFAVCLALSLMVGIVGAAVAGNPSGTGQPNASCENSRLQPNGFTASRTPTCTTPATAFTR